MIKSKIDARERALEMAVELAKAQLAADYAEVDIAEITRQFVAFLLGDAELPETQSDTELVKAFLEVMNSELDKKCKPIPDYSEMLKAVQKGSAGISAEIPCKSDVE